MGEVNPLTLNDIEADVNEPVTLTVWELNVHEPVKSMKELHDKLPIVNVLASVSQRLEGTMVESEGSKVTFNVTAESRVSGVKR